MTTPSGNERGVKLDAVAIQGRIREFEDALNDDRVNSKWITFAPNTWEKRLNKFISSYGNLDNDEMPLFFWDCSSLFSKKGLLLTDQAVLMYSTEGIFTLRNRIYWHQITSVVKEGKFIWINGRRFFNWASDKKYTIDLVIELLRAISGVSAEQKNADYGEVPTLVDESWGTIEDAEEPMVLLFPYTGEDGADDFKSHLAGKELYEGYRYGSQFKFAKVYHQASPVIIEKLGITCVPAIAIVRQGASLATLSDDKVNSISAAMAIDRVLDTLQESDGLDKLKTQATKAARQAKSKMSSGRWQNCILSGIIAGVIAAFAFAKLPLGVALLPAGFGYAFCVHNPNFRFNWFQRLVATVIMLIIAMEWQWILDLVKSSAANG